MHKIVLFGGTTEGRLLTEFLSQNKVPAIVCVATEYGEKVLEYEPPVLMLHILMLQKSANTLRRFVRNRALNTLES